MTKAEYIAIKDRPILEWSTQECREADALIKRITLLNASRWLKANVPDKFLRDYIHDMIRCTFGSVTTDALCVHHKLYPEWMK